MESPYPRISIVMSYSYESTHFCGSGLNINIHDSLKFLGWGFSFLWIPTVFYLIHIKKFKGLKLLRRFVFNPTFMSHARTGSCLLR